ncbi:enoyl-CoA hydratase/isomerase family protein [Ferrovibrio sp.]|uniref:enoyl-CoA hydratase/isomerase family protein n=1 Tax=Ferrovibrio sp. TaxID=1917215 RepID=UPI00262A6225|nr:enoyl-CoA hydratase/isomerase family protein [Ferrovibrio sp.]
MAFTRLDIAGPVARLSFNRPERHNSLVPELIAALKLDLARLAMTPDLRVLVLQAEGRSFSTGGDVGGFFAVPRGERRAYADGLVGGLNDCIMALLNLPIPVLSRIQGPVTGGSLGFLLACDLVAITPRAFIQPYYTEVGFSPDGGWTALLPARIGDAAAREIQLRNRRVSAAEAVQLGLATALVEPEALDATIDGWLAELLAKQPAAIAATKACLLPAERRATIVAALELEKQSFLDQIDSEEAHHGMARFLAESA